MDKLADFKATMINKRNEYRELSSKLMKEGKTISGDDTFDLFCMFGHVVMQVQLYENQQK